MRKILIVEDEINLHQLYRKELEEEGYAVEVTSWGLETMNKIKESSPELVVLDVKLPDVSGLKVLEQIKGYNKNLPVILNTSYSTYKHDFSSWIADAYIIKSAHLDELKRRIGELLNN